MAKRSKSVAGRKAAPKKGAKANSEYKAVIDDLVAGNRILYDQDVVDGYGHLSARDPRDPGRFLMSRARAPGLVVAADIMEFGMDGEPIRPDGRPIYSERFIHSEIYKARPDVQSVVHSHSPTVIPFSVTQEPLKPIRAPFFYPEVPVFDTRDAAGWTDLLDFQSRTRQGARRKARQQFGGAVARPWQCGGWPDRTRRRLSRGLHRGQRQAAPAREDAGRAGQLSRAGRGRDHGGEATRAAWPRQRSHLGAVCTPRRWAPPASGGAEPWPPLLIRPSPTLSPRHSSPTTPRISSA